MEENFTTPIRNKHLQNVLSIPSSPLMQNLGYGTGAAVYRMIRSPTTQNSYRSPWAIKKIAVHGQKNVTLATRLKEEATILQKLSHQNIVGFRAFTTNDKGEKCLAMEDCDQSLGDLIDERFETNMDMFQANIIMRVANDLASALEYLHNTALILHCDVKSFNVLIKGNFEICKLCDFGVSMPLLKDGTLDTLKFVETAEYIGTPAWCPREILRYPSIITDRADIYSLGLVLWEMLALSPPPQPQNENSNYLDEIMNGSDLNQYMTIPSNHSRPNLPEIDFPKEYYYILELFYCMTDDDYTKRPKATDLVIIISAMIEMQKKN